jgi:hypothetical protein
MRPGFDSRYRSKFFIFHKEKYFFPPIIMNKYKNEIYENIYPTNIKGPKIRRHSSFYYNHSIYFFGGIDDNSQYSNSLYRFCLLKNEWKELKPKGEKPSCRCGHINIIYQGKLYIHGGSNSYSDDKLNDFWEYNIEENTWKKIETKNTPKKAYHVSGLNKDKLIIFGGYNGFDEDEITLYTYNFTNKQWRKEEEYELGSTLEYSSCTGVIYKENFYISGSYITNITNNILLININDYKIKILKTYGEVPSKLFCHVSVVYGNSM